LSKPVKSEKAMHSVAFSDLTAVFDQSRHKISWQQQIGNIASTLANISRYTDSPAYSDRQSINEVGASNGLHDVDLEVVV
jgi:hypothetical protein